MRLLSFILLSSIILVGCNQEEPSGDENVIQEETSEENSAEKVDSEEETSKESSNEEVASEEGADTQTNEKDDESGGGNAEEEVEEEPPLDLLANMSFIEGYWINYSGVNDPRSHMARTDFISYDPEKDYTLTASSYVSYYYGEEFIKTNNYGHGGSLIIEKVPEADRIIVSVEKSGMDELSFYDAAMEDAKEGEEVNTTPEELVGRGKLVVEDLKGQIMFGQDFLSEENLTAGERINDNGSFTEDENYMVTEALEYNPLANYVITVPASISYYSGRNFIETKEIEEAPAYIPQVHGANYINISFEEDYIYELNVIEAD
ncbi:hypothetical protein [Salinicoccus sp. HZC-1]|uniref:hypothetical protein n=1 Tax=Salinicoccus sp. HZC-1 TaxID=3385497 RepID=UPI00398AF58E